MKRKIKYISICIIVLLLGTVVYINLFSPVVVEKKYIELRETYEEACDGDVYGLESHKNDIEKGTSSGGGMQVVRTSDKMPSYDKEDYMDFFIFVDIKNISFFEQRQFDIYFDTSDDSRIILKSGSLVTEWVKPWRKKSVWMVNGTIYSKGLNDEEIVDYISRQKARLVVHNDLMDAVTIDIDLKGAVLTKDFKWSED